MAYVSVKGIPDPTFGTTNATPAQPAAWPSTEAAGYYYVDNTNSSATNTGNTFGYPNKPRTTPPTSFAAGSVCYIRGGPYAGQVMSCSGVSTSPVYVTGDSTTATQFTSVLDFQGTYGILEYVHVNGNRIRLGNNTVSGTKDSFLTARHNEVSNSAAAGSNITIFCEDSVVWDNHLHDNTNQGGGGEVHGLLVTTPSGASSRVVRVWLIENTIERVGADAIQFLHGANDPESGPHLIYIGRNTLAPWNPSTGTSENCIDLKGCGTVIVAENDMSGTQDTATGNGECLRVNNGEGSKDGPIWITRNRFHDAFSAVNPAGNQTFPNGVYVVGNIFENITNIAIGEDTTHAVNNTLYNCGSGVLQATTECRNNLLHTITSTAAIAQSTTCSNNLVYNSGTVSTNCTSGSTSDPLLIEPAVSNFHLNTGSPAIGAGHSNPSVYDTFEAQFPGLSIRYDYDGNAWTNDIGALAFSTPATPDNKRVRRRLMRRRF